MHAKSGVIKFSKTKNQARVIFYPYAGCPHRAIDLNFGMQVSSLMKSLTPNFMSIGSGVFEFWHLQFCHTS